MNDLMHGNGPLLFDEEEAGVLKRLLKKLYLLPPEMIRVSYVYRDEVLVSATIPMREYSPHMIGQQICFDGRFRSFPDKTSFALNVVEETFSNDPPTATIRVALPLRQV